MHGSSCLDTYVLRLSDAEKEMAEWINYIVVKNMPISIVDCLLTRNIVKLKPVSSRSVRKHVLNLVNIVREEVKVRLPDRFVVVFDGWTEGTDHYVGISASYNIMTKETRTVNGIHHVDSKETTVQSLLSMRPLLVDGIQGMTANDHVRHITRVLAMYGKDVSNIICLVGDNCSVNQSVAKTMAVPLIGCGSHKFNLAVSRWIKHQPELTQIIGKVATVMKKASTLKIAAKLRQLTKYACVKENDTRWSSTFNMVKRYFKIQPQLNAIVELLTLLPTPVEVDALARGFRSLTKFDAITVMLQREAITLVEVRNVFNIIVADYPTMRHHVGDDSHLVVYPAFENAVLRISMCMPLLCPLQQHAVANLVRPERRHQHLRGGQVAEQAASLANDEEEDDFENYAHRVAKRMKLQLQAHVPRDQYINLDVIPGTSVNCERLFSVAKHILTDTRKNTSPLLFEALMFLKLNRNLWNHYSVGKAMGRTRDDTENAGHSINETLGDTTTGNADVHGSQEDDDLSSIDNSYDHNNIDDEYSMSNVNESEDEMN